MPLCRFSGVTYRIIDERTKAILARFVEHADVVHDSDEDSDEEAKTLSTQEENGFLVPFDSLQRVAKAFGKEKPIANIIKQLIRDITTIEKSLFVTKNGSSMVGVFNCVQSGDSWVPKPTTPLLKGYVRDAAACLLRCEDNTIQIFLLVRLLFFDACGPLIKDAVPQIDLSVLNKERLTEKVFVPKNSKGKGAKKN